MSLPPAEPIYILRGHAAQVHAIAFIRSNSRLVSGDSEGWIVSWSLEIKRPVAVWRAHEGAILGVDGWGSDKLITHGKDNKLIVWKYSEEDEVSLSKILPADHAAEPRKQPWLLHILEVNTMNFCSFAHLKPLQPHSESASDEELFIAVPNTMGSETVDLFHLPSCRRVHTVPAPKSIKGGMVMTVALTHHLTNHSLTVITGYENGQTAVTILTQSKSWETTYISQSHSQPVLSLSVSPGNDYYLTSAADAIIAKHPIPPPALISGSAETTAIKTIQTKHSGQQGLRIRNDGKIFATAGWDARVRVYSCKGMKELAVLKWHKEGCYAVAFAKVDDEPETEVGSKNNTEDRALATRSSGLISGLTVKDNRIRMAQKAHWLAAGSKDGRISLWIIY